MKRRPTGELKLFKKIWIERGPWSQISNDEIHSPHPWNFAHILPKDKYPHFRLNQANIWIMTQSEHHTWDNKRSSITNDPMWQKVFEKEAELIRAYKTNPNP